MPVPGIEIRAPNVKASEEIALTARPSASTATQLVVSPAIPVGAPTTAGSRPKLAAGPRQLGVGEQVAPGVVVRGAALVPVPEGPAGRLGQQVHRLGARRRQSGEEPVEEPGLLQQHPAGRRRRRLVDGDVAVGRADRVLRRHVAHRAPTRRRRTARRRRAAARPRAARSSPRVQGLAGGGPAARCCRRARPTTAGRRPSGRRPPGSSHRARSSSRASASACSAMSRRFFAVHGIAGAGGVGRRAPQLGERHGCRPAGAGWPAHRWRPARRRPAARSAARRSGRGRGSPRPRRRPVRNRCR